MHDAVRPGPRPAREYYRACGRGTRPTPVPDCQVHGAGAAPPLRSLTGPAPAGPGEWPHWLQFTESPLARVPAPGGPHLPAGARLAGGTRRCSGSSRPKSTAEALSCQRRRPRRRADSESDGTRNPGTERALLGPCHDHCSPSARYPY